MYTFLIPPYTHTHTLQLPMYLMDNFPYTVYQWLNGKLQCLRWCVSNGDCTVLHWASNAALQTHAQQIDGLVQDCSISSVIAYWIPNYIDDSVKESSASNLKTPLSCTDPSAIWHLKWHFIRPLLLDQMCRILTHSSQGNLNAILKMEFSILFYWLVSSDLLMIMPSDECHKAFLIISHIGPMLTQSLVALWHG